MTENDKCLKDWYMAANPKAAEPAGNRWIPSIELEKAIGKQIYDALQGEVVEEVLRKTHFSNNDAYWRNLMEGHSLKIEKDLLDGLYELCHEVKAKLDYNENVDFYITGDSTVNAFSLAAEHEGDPHIVNINSALFSLMTTDELKFVIGHELGHLINRDTALRRLINFVFPNPQTVPVTLQYKIMLHNQLAELVADRYGFLATENFEACVTAFFKLASGLDLTKMDVSIDALIADNNKRLDYFMNDKGVSRSSHPVNPIRVQALNLFANASAQEELEEGMNGLISILLKVGGSELEENYAKFLASSGIIVANLDSNISSEEFQRILHNLAGLKIFPRHFLDEIAQGDYWQVFNESVNNILKINPGMKIDLLAYTIDIVMADKVISKDEIELINKFGATIGFSDLEIASVIATSIQRSYVPSLESIC